MKTIQQITKTVAEQFGLTVADLRSQSRVERIVQARNAAMYLAHLEQCDRDAIACYFHRHPRTIYYSIACVQERASIDRKYATTITALHAA